MIRYRTRTDFAQRLLAVLGVPRCPCAPFEVFRRVGCASARALSPLSCALRCSAAARAAVARSNGRSNGRGTAQGRHSDEGLASWDFQMPRSCSCRRRISHRFRPDEAARAHSTKPSPRIRHDCLTDAALVSVAPAPHEGVRAHSRFKSVATLCDHPELPSSKSGTPTLRLNRDLQFV